MNPLIVPQFAIIVHAFEDSSYIEDEVICFQRFDKDNVLFSEKDSDFKNLVWEKHNK